jgi:phosphoglycolate phosphatase-like HAD superfamily hydrolase
VTTDGGATGEPASERATAPRILVSFDIDGTMEFGDPPGPVPASVARELFERGYIVGVASDWPRSSQQPLWSQHGMEPHFVGGKHHLHEVRAQFPADRYVHVGDTAVDERYALLAGFEFLLVTDLQSPVVADSIHDDDWLPPD